MSAGFTDDELAAVLPALRRWCLYLARDPDEAQDLAQDTLARALQKRHLYRPGHLDAWLITIAARRWATLHRRRGQAVTIVSVANPPEPVAPDNPELALQVRDLKRALAALPERQCRAVLVGALGHNYIVAAKKCRRSLPGFRHDLCDGRAALRQALAALALLLALAGPAAAHEPQEPFADWYLSLTMPEGGSCCGMSHDCAPAEYRIGAAGYQVLHQGMWAPVPGEAVLHVGNPTGAGVACWHGGHLLCFVPSDDY